MAVHCASVQENQFRSVRLSILPSYLSRITPFPISASRRNSKGFDGSFNKALFILFDDPFQSLNPVLEQALELLETETVQQFVSPSTGASASATLRSSHAVLARPKNQKWHRLRSGEQRGWTTLSIFILRISCHVSGAP
jgi:hypothetical protein